MVTKVLYVEDNEDDVYMLKMRLELLDGFEVLTAQNGQKGCEMAAAERPDIIHHGPRNARSRRVGSHAVAEEQPANVRHPGRRSVRACAGGRARKGVCGGL